MPIRPTAAVFRNHDKNTVGGLCYGLRIASALAAAFLLGIAGAATARAQESEQRYDFNIPSKSLSQAVRDYGQASGQEVIFTEDLVVGRTAPAIKGKLTAAEALEQLLRGTGLTAERSPSGALMIRRARNPDHDHPDFEVTEARSPAETSPTSQATTSLQEIVVTARKVEENLQDVPISITAISGEELIERNAVAIIDVQWSTPSLFIRSTSASPTTLSFAIRGQFQGSGSLLTDPSVATYVDGVYWARAFGLNTDLLDVRDVQVLKGPQGTLFGRNTTGGAVLIQSNDPVLDQTTASVSARYGRFDERSGTGVINVPLIDDRLALRVAAQRNLRDGWVKDILSGDRYRDIDSSTVRAKLLFQPTDRVSVLLSGEYFENDTAGTANQLTYLAPAGLTPPAPTADVIAAGAAAADFLQAAGLSAPPGVDPFTYPTVLSVGALLVAANSGGQGWTPALALGQTLAGRPDAAALDAQVRNQTEARTAGLTVTAETDIADFKLISGFRKVSDLGASDADGSPYPILAFAGGVLEQKQYSAELQATGTAFSDLMDFVTGVYFFNEQGDSASSVQGATTTDYDNFGLYGQTGYRVTDRFSLTGGLRYSVDDKQTILRTGMGDLEREDEFTGWSYLAGAEYRLNPDSMLYAKVSRSFRSGGHNSLPTQPSIEPEIATSYELGQKGEFFDNRLRMNLAAYYSLTDDIQRTSFTALPDGSTQALIRNAGELEVWGVEAEFSAQLPHGFQISLTGGVTEPEYRKYAELPHRTNLTGDRSSERIDSVPTRQFSASVSYDHTFSSADLAIRAGYSWTDEFALMPNVAFPGDPLGVTIDPSTGKTIMQSIIDATTAPASEVVNARASLTFADGRYEVALWGRNLFDNRDPVSALSITTLNFASIQRREPRTYGIEARARF